VFQILDALRAWTDRAARRGPPPRRRPWPSSAAARWRLEALENELVRAWSALDRVTQIEIGPHVAADLEAAVAVRTGLDTLAAEAYVRGRLADD
jgi:hypothetical protein